MSKKYFDTKAGSLESAVLEAVSPAQQAAIAIAKKEKGEKPKNEETKLQEKPADLLVLQFRSSSDAARAYKVLTQKVAGNLVPYEDAYDEGDELVIEFPDDADKLMKDMKSKGAPSFKVLEREEYSDFAKTKSEELTAKQKKIDLNKNGKVDGDDLKKLRAKKDEEVDLDEKPADFIRLTFNNSADVKKAKKWMEDNLPGADQGFTGIDYRDKDIEFEDVDDAEDLMAKLKKAGFKFKIDYREEVSEAKGTYVGDTSMVERAAKHITDMWKESAKVKKEEEEPKGKEDKKTMTGKPVSKVEVSPEDPEGK